MTYSPDAAKAFLFAIREAAGMGHGKVQAEHLLLGLANANQDIKLELSHLGFPLERLRNLIKNTHQASSNTSLPSYHQTLRQTLKQVPEQVTAKGLFKILLLDTKGSCYALLSSSADFPRFYQKLSAS